MVFHNQTVNSSIYHVKMMTFWVINCSRLAILITWSDNNLTPISHPAMNLISGTWRRFGIISPIIQMTNSKRKTPFIPLLTWCWVSVTSFQGFPFVISHPNYKSKFQVLFACSIFKYYNRNCVSIFELLNRKYFFKSVLKWWEIVATGKLSKTELPWQNEMEIL